MIAQHTIRELQTTGKNIFTMLFFTGCVCSVLSVLYFVNTDFSAEWKNAANPSSGNTSAKNKGSDLGACENQASSNSFTLYRLPHIIQ